MDHLDEGIGSLRQMVKKELAMAKLNVKNLLTKPDSI